MSSQFIFADELRNACLYCALIGRLKYREELLRGVLPTEMEPTATVTFIRIDGNTYAVTAAHVISIFEELRASDGTPSEGYFCPARPGVAILGPFIRPLEDALGHRPDIAICPVDSSLPSYIGKQAFVVRRGNEPSFPISHAMATGFPTASKFDVVEAGAVRLRMQCVDAVAEGVGSVDNNDQVQFFSEIGEAPEIHSLSGMSGGPVFWSTETTFGLLGFIKEAMGPPADGEDSIYERPRVHFVCQRASFDMLEVWTKFVGLEWSKVRGASRSLPGDNPPTVHGPDTTEFESMRKAGIQDYWFQIPNGPLLIACDVLLGQLHQARAEGTLPAYRIGETAFNNGRRKVRIIFRSIVDRARLEKIEADSLALAYMFPVPPPAR
jgi:hypothetical protein